MVLSISFFAVAMSFIAISMSYFSRAKQMPTTTDAETDERKNVQNTGITFLTIGISFICISIVFAMR